MVRNSWESPVSWLAVVVTATVRDSQHTSRRSDSHRYIAVPTALTLQLHQLQHIAMMHWFMSARVWEIDMWIYGLKLFVHFHPKRRTHQCLVKFSSDNRIELFWSCLCLNHSPIVTKTKWQTVLLLYNWLLYEGTVHSSILIQRATVRKYVSTAPESGGLDWQA